MTTINDIRFNRLHCKELLEQNKIDDAKVYIKKFFFSFQNKIFFNDGIQFILYPREEALKLIPNDLKTSVILPNEQTKKYEKTDISLKDYIKNCPRQSDHFRIRKRSVSSQDVQTWCNLLMEDFLASLLLQLNPQLLRRYSLPAATSQEGRKWPVQPNVQQPKRRVALLLIYHPSRVFLALNVPTLEVNGWY